MLIAPISSYLPPADAYIEEYQATLPAGAQPASLQRAEVLEEMLFAVHATKVFPKNGILKAGFAPEENEKDIPNFRYTVHFSLGEMVRPVEGVIDWEDCPYAVVTPFRSLARQCVNLNAYDTYILGDFVLTADSILVVPAGMVLDLPQHVNVRLYDPSTSSLRMAVDRIIAGKGGWRVQMNDSDDENMLKPALLNGKNINTPEFFAPLLKKYPYISVGLRFDSLSGEAYRLGTIENLLVGFWMNLTTEDYASSSLIALKLLHATVRHHVNCFTSRMQMAGLPSETLMAFEEKKPEIDYWLNIISNEVAKSGQPSSEADDALSIAHTMDDFSLEEARAFMELFQWPCNRDLIWVHYGWERFLGSSSEDSFLLSLLQEKWPLVRKTEEGRKISELIKARSEYILSDPASKLHPKAKALLNLLS